MDLEKQRDRREVRTPQSKEKDERVMTEVQVEGRKRRTMMDGGKE